MKYLFLFTLTLLMASCEEVINITLNTSEPVMIAEGVIEPDSVGWVKLCHSSGYFKDQQPKYIENAIVTLSDGIGNSELLKYQGSGLYRGKALKGRANKRYTMNITLGDNRFQAESTLLSPSEINFASFEELEFQRPGDTLKSYSLILNFRDNPETENYYLIKFWVNGIHENNSYTLLKDSYYSATNTIEYKSMRNRFDKGDTVIVRLYSIDKDVYTYYNQLNDLKETEMGASSTPYNPKSNFGPDVLGFFAAYSSSSYMTIVK